MFVFDCAGVPNGDSWASDCGCVAADNSGDDCDDCDGVPNGDSWISDCGCVTADNSGDECDDCAGVPNGGSWTSDCGCVDADNSGDDCDDCDGVPNGDAELDECNVCQGSGPDLGFDCAGNCLEADICGIVELDFVDVESGSAKISYSSNVAVYGFQFNVNGVTLTDASSDFDPTNSGNNVVIGFSINGESIPAGDGILASLTFEESAGGGTISLSDVIISGLGVEISSSGTDAASGPELEISTPRPEIITSLRLIVPPPADSSKVREARIPSPAGIDSPLILNPITTLFPEFVGSKSEDASVKVTPLTLN
jgi:hypothetical protein